MIRCEFLSEVSLSSTQLPSFPVEKGVPTYVGKVRLRRQQAFKHEVFLPVIPTRYALLLFPGGAADGKDGAITENGVQSIDAYLQWLCEEGNLRIKVVNFLVSPDVDTVLAVVDTGSTFDTIALHQCCSDYAVGGDGEADSFNGRRVLSFPTDVSPIDPDKLARDYYAIPTCTLCGDRLERSISGYPAAVCNCPRNKQCTCVYSSKCAVCCTLVTALANNAAFSADAAAATNKCSECDATDDTWICLVCGYIGCSRYQKQHAAQHFQWHSHHFSLSLSTQQIWDYDSDRFVHRMIVMFNSDTGATERLQFPDRGLDEAFADAEDGTAALSGPRVASERRGPDGECSKYAVKKYTDAKNDVRIEETCMDLARLINAQLDANRAQYEAELLESASSTSHTGGTHADPVQLQSQGSGEVERSTTAAEGTAPPPKAAYDNMNAVMGDMNRARKCRKDWISAYNAARNLNNELVQRAEEQSELSTRHESLKAEYRAILERDMREEMRLDEKIRDLKETIAEVRLNISVGNQLQNRLHGDTVVTRIALLDGSSRPSAGQQQQARKDRRKK